MSKTPEQRTPTLEEFDRLIDELVEGEFRSRYWPWEVELLLDISDTPVTAFGNREEVSRQYQAAVHRGWVAGSPRVMTLNEYLAEERLKAKMRTRAGRPSRKKSA